MADVVQIHLSQFPADEFKPIREWIEARADRLGIKAQSGAGPIAESALKNLSRLLRNGIDPDTLRPPKPAPRKRRVR